MQAIAEISPATYALEGTRAAILEGAGIGDLWSELAALSLIGLVAVPLGLALFSAGERYAKRNGKLKRSG
jgi:ABC-2 type transport system permease protein